MTEILSGVSPSVFIWSMLDRRSSAAFLLPRPEKGVWWPNPCRTHQVRVAAVALKLTNLVSISRNAATGRVTWRHLFSPPQVKVWDCISNPWVATGTHTPGMTLPSTAHVKRNTIFRRNNLIRRYAHFSSTANYWRLNVSWCICWCSYHKWRCATVSAHPGLLHQKPKREAGYKWSMKMSAKSSKLKWDSFEIMLIKSLWHTYFF